MQLLKFEATGVLTKEEKEARTEIVTTRAFPEGYAGSWLLCVYIYMSHFIST